MSKTKKPRDPAEVPQPDKNPEVTPATTPENPVSPDEDPGIVPQTEPEEPTGPSPAEIPPPQPAFFVSLLHLSR
ncbi:hypothetical protein [Puia sp.]|jgi:hypothetical protein|uniref:hypothetical protein n=1 Tax=Puia sp. TaxID=2045100 RepID=UPI002D808F44|nr:hypothetical protein [Puia sp.]